MTSLHHHARKRRGTAAALALGTAITLGGALPLTTATTAILPVAAAQNSGAHQTLQGTLNWAVKASFLNYIKGPIAKGSWTTSGATDKGNSFDFNISKGYVTSEGIGFAHGTGTVTFTGHGGKLKTTLTDPTVKLTGGGKGQLLVKMTSQDPEGNPISGLDGWVHLADVNFGNAITGGGTFTGKTTLTSTGSKAFAEFWEPGTELADITLNLSGTEANGAFPTLDGIDNVSNGGGSNSGGNSGTTITNKDWNLNTGHGGLDALNLLNEYLESGHGAINNTIALLDQMDKLANRGKNTGGTTGGTTGGNGTAATTTGGNTGGTSTTGGNGTSNTATGGTGTNRASATGAATTTGGNAATARAAAANPTGVIGTVTGGNSTGGGGNAETCTAVNNSQIAWGVKKSFRSYIRGSIAKGGWEGQGVGESGDAFLFTGSDGSVDANTKVGSVNTGGTLRFYGHSGKLNLVISNLRATFNGSSGQLIADVESSDVEGTPKNFGTVAVGDLSYASLDVNDSSVKGTAEVTLTAAGADAFAGFYEPGIQLDPIAITAELGGSADCGAATGGASGASDGTAASASGAASALKGGGSSGSSTGSSTSGNKSGSKSGSTASNAANASSSFGEKGKGGVTFHNGDSEDADIQAAGMTTGSLTPAQLVAMAAAFAIAAGSCLALTYKRKPQA